MKFSVRGYETMFLLNSESELVRKKLIHASDRNNLQNFKASSVILLLLKNT